MIESKLNFFIAISSVLILLSTYAYADKNLSDINLGDLAQSMTSYQKSENQKVLMPLLRKAFREKVLSGTWAEYQKNPDFSLGALKAKDLFQKLDGFQLLQATTNGPLHLDPERVDDLYLTSTGYGLVNKVALKHESKTLTALTLHIFLGASGWQDENYQLSLAILSHEASLLSPSHDPIKKIDHQRLFPKNSNELNRSEKQSGGDGGFTSVGGGGDGNSLTTKLLMYSYIFALNEVPMSSFCRKKWEDPTQLAIDIQNVEIESIENFNTVQEVKINSNSWKVLIPKFSTKNSDLAEVVAILSLSSLCRILEAQP